jgi:hypothetical protein
MIIEKSRIVGDGMSITVTLGTSVREFVWKNRRELLFDELSKMLTSPSVGNKDGACYTPAIFDGHARRMDKTVRIDIAVLDADCGHNLLELEAAIRKKGWIAIIHSTHSHLTNTTSIAATPFEKWQAENPEETVETYLLQKKGFLPRVVKGARITDEVRDGTARNLVVEHQPCPKFRIVIPLERPWVAAEFESQNAANTRWRERIGALAHALNMHHDQSCVDTSRLFYFPRIKSQDSVFEYAVIREGIPCSLFDLPDATIESPLFNAPVQKKLREVKISHVSAVSEVGEFVDLTEWAAQYAKRFQIVDALREKASGIFTSRKNGVKAHIICPNSGDHVTGGAEQTGTYAVNAADLPRANLPSITSGFVIHCMHAGCSHHDRLDHLKAMLADGTLEVSDLTDERFLVPEEAVDISNLMKKLIGGAPTIKHGEYKAYDKASNIPPHLYANLPPVMKDMHDFICGTAVKPQPALALASVLTFFGAAIGRKAELQDYGVRANIYALAIAHSGAGKERLLSAPKQVATSAGLFEKIIGVEEVASDAGIVTAVHRQPNQVMLLDEVSFLIGATNNAKAGVHMTNVTSTLLKLYSSSATKFKGKSYADADQIKTVDEPCVCVLGCSTPAGLFAALGSKDVTNGLLSRFVLFDAGDHDPLGGTPAKLPVPDSVVSWLQAWDQRDLNSNAVEMVGGNRKISPETVSMTPEALAVARDFETEMHAAKIAARERGTDALFVRARENALKFALVYACSAPVYVGEDGKPKIDPSALYVTGDVMRWACELSRVTIEAMERGARDEIADTPFEARLKAVRRLVEKAGSRGLTEYEIKRNRSGRLPERDFRDVVKALVDAGDIALIQNVNPGRGRKRQAYVYKEFFEDVV